MSLMKHLLAPDFYLLFPDSFNVLDHLSLRVTALKSHPDVECWHVHADMKPLCLSQSLGHVLAWAAITRSHTWRPKQQTRISYGSGGSKVKIKVPPGLVSGEIFLPEGSIVAMSSRGLPSVCARLAGAFSSSYKDTSPIRSGPLT